MQTERLLKASSISNGKLQFTGKKPDTVTAIVYNRGVSEFQFSTMNYPKDALFDIDTLINEAQPRSILLLGDVPPNLLANYVEQKAVLTQDCVVTHFPTTQVSDVLELNARYDVAVVINLFEHIPKRLGERVLSRLRDVLAPQYCVCLSLASDHNHSDWHLTDLFSFALKKVSEYPNKEGSVTLFKYNIDDYKSTPDWLNPDNWANPNMWEKYRW